MRPSRVLPGTRRRLGRALDRIGRRRRAATAAGPADGRSHGGRMNGCWDAGSDARGRSGLVHLLRIEDTPDTGLRSVWRGGADRRLGRLRRGRRGTDRSRLRPARRRRARRSLWPRQEKERIQVPVRLAASPHAQIDVGHRQLGLAAWADRADRRALRDRGAAPNRHGAEMQDGDRVAVLGLDRDGPAADGDGPCEGDDSGCRREHRCPRGRSDVDSAMLAGRVRIVAEQEGPQYRALHRPRPAESRGRPRKRGGDRGAHQKSSRQQASTPSCQLCKHRQRSKSDRSLSNQITARSDRAGCVQPP